MTFNDKSSEKKNSWIPLNEKTILDSSFVKIVQQRCRSSENNFEHDFYLLRSLNWCNIIPITEDGKLVLVKQFRMGVAHHTFEIPGGVVDAGEEPQAAALRELTEETGYEPLPNSRCIPLGRTHSNPALLNNFCNSFIVGPVRKSKSQNLDPAEMIEVVELSLEEVSEKILSNEITNACALNAFLFVLLKDTNGSRKLGELLTEFSKET